MILITHNQIFGMASVFALFLFAIFQQLQWRRQASEWPADRLYGSESLGSKYQGQIDPTASRFHWDYERAKS